MSPPSSSPTTFVKISVRGKRNGQFRIYSLHPMRTNLKELRRRIDEAEFDCVGGQRYIFKCKYRNESEYDEISTQQESHIYLCTIEREIIICVLDPPTTKKEESVSSKFGKKRESKIKQEDIEHEVISIDDSDDEKPAATPSRKRIKGEFASTEGENFPAPRDDDILLDASNDGPDINRNIKLDSKAARIKSRMHEDKEKKASEQLLANKEIESGIIKPAFLFKEDLVTTNKQEEGLSSAEGSPETRMEKEDVVKPVQNNPINLNPVKQEEAKQKLKEARGSVMEKYEDRILLQRFFPGIARLGGGGQDTSPRPCRKNKYIWDKEGYVKKEYPLPKHLLGCLQDFEEPETMSHFSYCCFDSLWQVNGPKFSGQPTAAVDYIPDFFQENDLAFPIFMKRTMTKKDAKATGKLLGWEYVGNYKCISDPDLIVWESAHNFPTASLRAIADGQVKSAQRSSGETYGRRNIDFWKEKLEEELKNDSSPAAPSYLVEKRAPTHEEIGQERQPLAARARALGFSLDHTFSDREIAEIMVRLDEFHKQYLIEFVEYDDRIYDYCIQKGGQTTHDGTGGMLRKASKARPAAAGDWYKFAKENMLL